MKKENYISVFEYEHLNLSDRPKELKEALDIFYGEKGVPYYSLTRTGVKFSSWVGVLQVGKYTIEVLPKIDKTTEDETTWQKVLIDMLRQSGMIQTDAPSEASLRLKSNSILDLYMELFLNECEYLLNRGLIKRYRQEEGNKTALKGALMFNKHISQNLVHKERFYVRHTVYDTQHDLNRILLKTIRLIHDISNSPVLKSKVGSLLLRFPEMPDIKVSDALFERIKFDRKSTHYRKAIDIARLLLLNYHPDISKGRNNLLALMFDMNVLWEKWVAKRLSRIAMDMDEVEVSYHDTEDFWNSEKSRMRLEPDLVITFGEKRKVVLDTKWKVVDSKPSPDDLRQMFAYNHRFGAAESYLVYPSSESLSHSGSFYSKKLSCGLEFVTIVHEGRLHDGALERFLIRLNAQQLHDEFRTAFP